MTKKIIILMLAIPLLLMVSLFSTTSNVTLAIDVPVSRIEVNGPNVLYLDLDKGETYKVDYTIYPINAVNKEVSFKTEQLGEEKLADLEFEDDTIIPKSAGIAKVIITTKDGGFSDSFIVQVDSKKLASISCSVSTNEIEVGQTLKINVVFNPSNASDRRLGYTSSNINIADVSQSGVITGLLKGEVKITVSSYENPNIREEIYIKVITKDIINISKSEITSSNASGELMFNIDLLSSYTLDYKLYDLDGLELSKDFVDIDFSKDDVGNIKATFNYKDKDFIGSIRVSIIVTSDSLEVSKDIILNKVNDIKVTFEKNIVPLEIDTVDFIPFNVIPDDTNLEFDISCDNDNVSCSLMPGNLIYVSACKVGASKITLTVSGKNDFNTSKTLDVIVTPSSLIMSSQAKTYGLENIFTLGNKTYGNSLFDYKLEVENASLYDDYIQFVTNNQKVVVSNSGSITFNDDVNEIVEFKCLFKYKDVIYKESPVYKIRCVGNAYNVSTYNDLYWCINNEKKVVLQKTIKEDFGKIDGTIKYSEIETTYDKQYYENINASDDAKVKVLLNIKNDIYGNGYEINAHNLTYGLDSNDQLKTDALFRGPLNFVALSESGGSSISVKGQDNIAFGLYEGVSLVNVELKSCDLIPDETNGTYDLTDLNYSGTTVEILGDNVDINYSRITNGRTLIRCFGDIFDSKKVINFDINNSVLSSAREFIIRMGSNEFIKVDYSDVNNPKKELPNDNDVSFPTYSYYSSLSSSEKENYDNNFIKTYVNIKDSLLKDSGLFAIGIDSHFSGVALEKGNEYLGGLIDSWHDLAKTSYGAKLTFIGDVRMYNWKNINDIDSSSLIETVGNSSYDMSFDIKEMLEFASQKEEFKNIITNYNNENYVHAGIAFFGGGLNYGVFDSKDYKWHTINGYTVSLKDVGKTVLETAAGDKPFYFLIHDYTTSSFTPQKQEELLKSENAYDFIKPKKN